MGNRRRIIPLLKSQRNVTGVDDDGVILVSSCLDEHDTDETDMTMEMHAYGDATTASKSSGLALDEGAQCFRDGIGVVRRKSNFLIGRKGSSIHHFDAFSNTERAQRKRLRR
jgi:hypothetical protein